MFFGGAGGQMSDVDMRVTFSLFVVDHDNDTFDAFPFITD